MKNFVLIDILPFLSDMSSGKIWHEPAMAGCNSRKHGIRMQGLALAVMKSNPFQLFEYDSSYPRIHIPQK